MTPILFTILSVLTLATACLVVFSKNPMHSVLYLIACFFTIAGHYILLNAQFLAIVHIIVYAGAIMVLFLFVVMLLNLNADTEPHKSFKLKLAAVGGGGLLFLTLIASMRSAFPSSIVMPSHTTNGFVEAVGIRLFTEYLLPFEISSILFLSAMVGAVLLAKREK